MCKPCVSHGTYLGQHDTSITLCSKAVVAGHYRLGDAGRPVPAHGLEGLDGLGLLSRIVGVIRAGCTQREL